MLRWRNNTLFLDYSGLVFEENIPLNSAGEKYLNTVILVSLEDI